MRFDLGTWAFGHKSLVYFLLTVLVVGGLLSIYDMSKLEDPEIKVKQAMVVAIYPGASAHEIEMEVTDPLEKSIRTIGELAKLSSWSYNDMALLQIEMKTTVPDEQIEQLWDLLRRKVDDTRASLPSGVTVQVRDDFGLVYGMLFALTGDGVSDRQMSDYAELVKRELGDLEEVARVEIYGDRTECIYVRMLPEKMAMLGVSPAELLATLRGQNDTYYAGYYDNGPDRIRVTVDDKFSNVEQIRRMVIQGHENDQLRLGDIATVESGYAEPERNSMTYDGQRALGIAVAAASGSDIVKVGVEVTRKLAELQATRFPTGLTYHKIFYQPERVTSSLLTFLVNLLESVLIVVAILMFSMGFRSGLIIGTSLAIIVVGSFLVLGLADGTMQRVSLASFIFAMGMLVDNAIVIVDGILVDLKNGKPRREAMTSIGRKTAWPLLGATLIAILAFFPVYLSPDTAGVYVRDLFIVLAVSLMLSWLLALVHVPLMSDHWLSKKPANESDAVRYDTWPYRWSRAVLRFSLRHRWTAVFIALGLMGLSGWGFTQMRQGFFPDMVYDQLYMEYKLPEGTRSDRVKADLAEIEAWLHQRPEVTHVTASIGGTPARYNLVRSIATPSLSYGELIIDFRSPKALEHHIDEIQRTLTERYPDAYVKLKRYNLMFKKYPIEVQFTGPDPAVLHQLSDQARRIMEETPEVELITTDWEPKIPVLHIDYEQSAARRMGLSRQNVAISMLSAAGGIPVGQFYEGIRKNTIYLQCTDEGGAAVDNLENVPVFSTLPSVAALFDEETLSMLQSGQIDRGAIVSKLLQTVPLKQVSRGIEVGWEDPVVPRYNGQRAQRVMCSPIPDLETEAARKAIVDRIEAIPLPAGYQLSWQGEKSASSQTMRYLFQNVPIGIVLILTILILLFGDYRKPAVILCGIPLVVVGVVGAMLISGLTFNFCAIVGVLGLVGMMIKNSVVLMDEIGEQLSTGKAPAEALIASSESRLRPVMMASLTTIFGMIPLLTDAMFGPMAATIMGGLLFSTFATLLFVPVLYALFFKIKIVS